MTSRDPCLALVLSGGGARGAFEAGVVQTLAEAGLSPGIVAGTSAGAITGAAVACGWDADRIAELWTSLQTRDVLRLRRDVHRLLRPSVLLQDPRLLLGAGRGTTSETLLDLFGWTWLLHLGPLRELLVDELGGEVLPLDDDVVLTLSAIEVDSGELVRFTNRELPESRRGGRADGSTAVVTELTVDHVLASASIPGLFRPVEVDGSSYWDGGLTSNTPLSGALEHEPDRALVVGAATAEPRARPPRSLGDVLALALDHVLRDALAQDVDTARTINELLARVDDDAHTLVELATVLPETPIEGIGDLLDFEPAVARDLVASGRDVARRVLEEQGWR